MGVSNEKEKAQAIAYQRDFLGSCWNSPYGVQEAHTFIASRWCGISPLFMELNTGHKCVALQAHRTPDAAKMEEHLDVMENPTATAAAIVVGGEESFDRDVTGGPASPLRATATPSGTAGFPASAKGDASAAKPKRPGLTRMATSEEHFASTIDLMLLQQRPAAGTHGGGGPTAHPASTVPPVLPASPTHVTVPSLREGVVGQAKPKAAASRPTTSFASNPGADNNHNNGSFSVASVPDSAGSSAGMLRRVVRDTQVVESALHNRQLYLRAYGLSVHQDVVFRAAPAHRRYDCIALVTVGTPPPLLARASLQFALPSRRGSRGRTISRLSRLPSPMHSPGDRGRPENVSPLRTRSADRSPNQSISGYAHSGAEDKDGDEAAPAPRHGRVPQLDEALSLSAPAISAAGSGATPRSGPSRLRRLPSPTAARRSAPRANNTGYAEFSVNPLHARYNYHLSDTEAAIPAARYAAAQGHHHHHHTGDDRAARSKGTTKADRHRDSALREYAAEAAPFIIGSISAVELQLLPHNAEVCLGGWLYVSLEDEQKRLRRVLDRYEAFLKEKQAAEAERERLAAEFNGSSSAGASAAAMRTPLRRGRRASRLPSPALSPRARAFSDGDGNAGGSSVGDAGDLLLPSALVVSKTTGTFASPATQAVTTDAIEATKSPSSASSPRQRPRASSLDGGGGRSGLATPATAGLSYGGGGGSTSAGAFRDPLRSGPTQRFLNSHRAADDPLAPEDFWVPHAYVIVAMPMYECSINPTIFHTLNNRTKPVSLNIANTLSREAFGVGCITGIRYGGVIVLECREPVTTADKDWLLALKRLGEQCEAMASEEAAKAAAAAAVPRDLSMSAAAVARRAAESERAGVEQEAVGDSTSSGPHGTPWLSADALERSVLRPYDAPLRDADLAWLHRKRGDKIRYLRRALRSKLRAEGFSVIFAYTRTTRYLRRVAARRADMEMSRYGEKIEEEEQEALTPAMDGEVGGRRTPLQPHSGDGSVAPVSDDDVAEDDANEDEMNADAQDDQDDLSSDEELELDWDGITSSHDDDEEGDGLTDTARRRRDDDPFTRRRRVWLANAAQDAPTPANYTIKGTFRQIGGVRYFDTASLLEGCAVRDVVEGVVRWARNLRNMPVKARPLSLFLQRYEGLASALRIAQGSTTRAVLQSLYRTGAPANVLLQANGSFSRTATVNMGGGGGVPTDSFSPGTVGSFNLASPAGPSPPVGTGPIRSIFPFITHYTGPLDPIVRAILSPEVEHMIRTAEEGVAATKVATSPLIALPDHASTGKQHDEQHSKAAANGQPRQGAHIDAPTHHGASTPPPPSSSPPVPHSTVDASSVSGVEKPASGEVSPTGASAPATEAPKTIANMLVGPAALPLPANTSHHPVAPTSAAVTNNSWTNGSVTSASFAGGSAPGPAGSVTNNSVVGGEKVPLVAPPRPHVLGEPTVSNSTFILQSGACVQRPPERFMPRTDEKQSDSRSSSSHSARGPPASADTHSEPESVDAGRGHREDDDEGEGPHVLNRTLRLSQIALDAVKAVDDRAGRSQEWLDADTALRQVKAELEEMRFLVANADVELEQRIQEYVTTSSLFLPHTRVDQTSLMLLSVKMLRQFPDDVPVKELHTDWLPQLLATLTLPGDHVFVTERALAVRDHQARKARAAEGKEEEDGVFIDVSVREGDGGDGYVMHSQDNVYGHLMPPEDVCDANMRREAFNDPSASSKYAIEAIRPLPAPQPLHEVVIAPIPYRITAKTALALQQQGVDATYSFCFTGGSLGVLAGVLRVYSDAMRERCQAEIRRALAAGGPDALRAAARNSTDLLIRNGYNVFLRRIWIWGSTSKKQPGFFQRLCGHDDLDDGWNEISLNEGDPTEGKQKKSKKKSRHRRQTELDSVGVASFAAGLNADPSGGNVDGGKHGQDSLRRPMLPYRLSEAYALFDAIMHYLRTYREMEKDFRNAVAGGAEEGHGRARGASEAGVAVPLKRRSFLQSRRTGAAAANAGPSAGEPLTDELLVTDFELCIATNYYYKRTMVERAYRPSNVFSAPSEGTGAATAVTSLASPALSATSQHGCRAKTGVRRKPNPGATATARRLLTKHEEQRRAHQLASLVLRHTAPAPSLKSRERSSGRRSSGADGAHSEKESGVLSALRLFGTRKSGNTDGSTSSARKASKKWRAMATEVEVPYCGGEEEEKRGTQDNAKGLYDFLEVSLGCWRESRQGAANGGSRVAPSNEAQDSCDTAYESAEVENMVRSAVKISLS